jgi:uncharacterized protein YlxW (UPF0749 family)
MDGGQLMVVMIVAVVTIASIIKARVKYSHGGAAQPDSQTHLENQRLRDEVQQLKERIKVIERITVEKENSLSRQIEELRDR